MLIEISIGAMSIEIQTIYSNNVSVVLDSSWDNNTHEKYGM